MDLTIIPGRSHNDKTGIGVNEYIVNIPLELHNETCNANKVVKCNYEEEER